MPHVTFQPFGLVVALNENENLFAAAQRSGIPVPTACGGRGNCGLCRVKVLAGEAALGPITADEKKHLGNSYFISKLRLSCRIVPHGDVVVQVPDASARDR